MKLPGTITPRSARRATALGILAALSISGLALATLSTGPFASPSRSRAAAPAKRGFAITFGPATRTVLPGEKATYIVRTFQRGRRRSVRLRIVSRLPPGVRSAIVWNARANPARRRLLLRTSTAARPGSYRVRVRAYRVRARTGGQTRFGRRSTTARTLRLIIAPPDARVTVGGRATLTLTPGTTSPVDIRVGNSGPRAARVSSLGVNITGIDAPRAGQGRPCGPADFTVRPYSGASFVLPARAELWLRDLGVPVSQWPQLTMLNRALNQDGCKGATLRLSFSATGGQIR